MQKDVEKIEGGFKRNLPNNISLYLYHRMFNSIVCIGDTDDLFGYRDQW
jgi:hypothetical protein